MHVHNLDTSWGYKILRGGVVMNVRWLALPLLAVFLMAGVVVPNQALTTREVEWGG